MSGSEPSGGVRWPSHPYALVPAPYAHEEPGLMAVFERTYRKVALFGGIYNNYWALDALLADAERRGCDLILGLGDMGGFGPHPERIVPKLRDAEVPTLAGNYDVSLARGLEDCGCGYTDPTDNYYAQISYVYTFANTPAEHRQWFATLPRQARINVGRFRVHCCHGSPRRTNEFLWESATSDALLERFLADCHADLLAFTHTGIKWNRAIEHPGGPLQALNVGVIGRPENDGTPDVWYAVVEDTGRLEIEPVRLAYDFERLAAEMRAERIPEEFVETTLSGWWTTCLEVLPAKERQQSRY